MAALPPKELRILLGMSVGLLIFNFKFRAACFAYSDGLIKRTGNVCGGSEDLKSLRTRIFT